MKVKKTTGDRLLLVLVMCSVAVFAGGTANASIISLDPDLAPEGTVLNDYFSGVTMTASGDSVNSSRVYSRSSQLAATGSCVFGYDGTYDPKWLKGLEDLRVDFAGGALNVWIDAIGNDAEDYAVLYAYNSSDVLIDSYSTGFLGYSNVETMTVSGNIAYIIASGNSSNDVHLDNLCFESIPEPATMLLLGLGGLGLRYRKGKAA